MQRGQTASLLLIGLLIIAVVGFGSYYLGRSQLSKPQNPISTSQPTSSPVSNPVDETPNWKTYTDVKYGFSIQYPSDWIEIEGEKQEFYYSPSFQSPNLKSDSYVPHLISGSWMAVMSNGGLYENLDQEEGALRSRKLPSNAGGPQIVSINRVSFADQDAIRVISHYDSRSLKYTLFKDGRNYNIVCHSPIGDDEGLKLCEKIAATFKFLK